MVFILARSAGVEIPIWLRQTGTFRVVRFALLKIALTNFPLRTQWWVLALPKLLNKTTLAGGLFFGALGGGRTHNLRLRKPTLYPVELRAHHFRGCKVYTKNIIFKRAIHSYFAQLPSIIASRLSKSSPNKLEYIQ